MDQNHIHNLLIFQNINYVLLKKNIKKKINYLKKKQWKELKNIDNNYKQNKKIHNYLYKKNN